MNRKSKVIVLSFIFVACVFSAKVSSAAEQPVKVFLNGMEILYDVPPQIISNRTMVPLSLTIQAVTGAPAKWDEATKTVTFYADGHSNVHRIGETVVYADGVPKAFDTPSLIIDSRTLMPIRMIAETSGCNVQWDADNRYVIITKAAQPAIQTPSGEIKIISVTPAKTSIHKGEATLLTIKTNSAASYVWVDYDDVSKNAVLTSTAADGTKTWTVECLPSEGQRLHIFANKSRNVETAVMEIQYIEVTGTESPSIVSISPNKTTLTKGDSMTLTVRTSGNVNYVWAEYDETYKNAKHQSTYSNGQKSWTVEIIPSSSQSVRVYANISSRTASGAASYTQNVTVNTTSSAIEPKISSVSADQTTIELNTGVVFIITTNSAAQYVWLTCDGKTTYADLDSDSGTVKRWSALVYPKETQRVYIYANTSSSQSGAASEIQYITVADSGNPEILNCSADNTTINPGDTFSINVKTTQNVNYVWVVIDGNMIYGDMTSPDANGNMLWQILCNPPVSQRINVFANTIDSAVGAVMENIYVTVSGE